MNDLVAELETIDLGDQRLNARARQVLCDLGARPGAGIPSACGGWAETKAAYRLFDHERVGPQEILEPHYACSERRLGEHRVVLCLQDTTELDYTGKSDIEGLGPLNYEARRGLYLHPTLAVTPDRVAPGVLDAWIWTREASRSGRAKAPHRSIEEKESIRWLEGYQRSRELQGRVPETRIVHVGDREADIYEIFAEHHQAHQSLAPCAEWLIRSEHDRKLTDGRKLRQAVYIVAKRQPPPEAPPSLNEMIRLVAGFGGFLNRKGDGFPGAQTLWIGLQRTRDFVFAIEAQRDMLESYG